MVLLDLLHRSGHQLEIAHVNYGLRGDASRQDESFVMAKSEELHLVCHIRRMEAGQVPSSGIQAWARSTRYKWFDTLCADRELDYILTAHHLDDSLETILFNLVRGSGLKGLSGIRMAAGKVRRPLISFHREGLFQYAMGRQLKWREDISNYSLKYSRNKIRQLVIPELQSIKGGLEGFKTSQEVLQSTQGYLEGKLQEDMQNLIYEEEDVQIIDIYKLSRRAEPAFILFNIISKYGFGFSQIKDILATSSEGTRFLTESHEATFRMQRLYVRKKLEDIKSGHILIPDHLKRKISLPNGVLSVESKERMSVVMAKNEICLDPNRVVFPLKLRKWAAGDRFQPFGMQGKSKKVQDLFTDLKLTEFAKRDSWILEDAEGSILWVMPWRASEKCRLIETNKLAMTIEWIPDRR